MPPTDAPDRDRLDFFYLAEVEQNLSTWINQASDVRAVVRLYMQALQEGRAPTEPLNVDECLRELVRRDPRVELPHSVSAKRALAVFLATAWARLRTWRADIAVWLRWKGQGGPGERPPPVG